MKVKTNNDCLQVIASGIEQFSDAAVVGVQEQLRRAKEEIEVLNGRVKNQEEMLKRKQADISNKNMTIQVLKDKIEEINDEDLNRRGVECLVGEVQKWRLVGQVLWHQLQTDEKKLHCCDRGWNGIPTLDNYYEQVEVAEERDMFGPHKVYKYKGWDVTHELKPDDMCLWGANKG